MRVLRVMEGPVIGVLLFLLFVETTLPVYGTVAHVTQKAGSSSQHTSGKQQAVHKLMSGLSQQSGKLLDSLAQGRKTEGATAFQGTQGTRVVTTRTPVKGAQEGSAAVTAVRPAAQHGTAIKVLQGHQTDTRTRTTPVPITDPKRKPSVPSGRTNATNVIAHGKSVIHQLGVNMTASAKAGQRGPAGEVAPRSQAVTAPIDDVIVSHTVLGFEGILLLPGEDGIPTPM